MGSSGNGEDIVQFLQRALLRFRYEEKDEDESDDVEAPRYLVINEQIQRLNLTTYA